MLSRVADSIYWMNRYIERAENYARFMDVNFNLSLERAPDGLEQWRPLVVTTGDWELYEKLHQKVEKRKVIYFLGFDKENPNSIYNCILNARESARAIRPEITKEVWEQINFLYYLVKDGEEKRRWKSKDPRDFFTEIKKGCQLLYGIFDATISRNDGWHFGKIGQLLERADKTSRVLDVKYHILLSSPKVVGSPFDLIQWTALLKSVSAYDMYRKKYGRLSTTGITEFLILDKIFPRSILRSIIHAEQSLIHITSNDEYQQSDVLDHLKNLKIKLENTDINSIIKDGLHEFLDELQIEMNTISTLMYENYFSIENNMIIKE